MYCLRLVVTAAIATTTTVVAAGESSSLPFAAIDPARVTVGGEIGRRINLTIRKNLLVIEVENQFLAPFRRKQSRLFDYIGLGKLIDATVSFAYYTRDPKVIALRDHLVKGLIATQLEDGYIGTFPPGARIRDVFDEHENGIIASWWLITPPRRDDRRHRDFGGSAFMDKLAHSGLRHGTSGR